MTNSMTKALALALFACAAPAAMASDYPPDYVIDSECKDVGPARVCSLNRRYGSFPRLSITYKGDLLASQWDRVSVYVTLNGRSGLYKMRNADFTEILTIGGPRNVTRCFEPSSPMVGKPYPACKVSGASWNYDLAPVLESGLFFYARDARGIANAWDVGLAFVAEDGTWDSNGGANYNVRFEN